MSATGSSPRVNPFVAIRYDAAMRTTMAAGLALFLGFSALAAPGDATAGGAPGETAVRTAPFTAPRMFALRAQAPAGSTIALERVDTGERRELRIEQWQSEVEATWLVPRDWVGAAVVVVGAASPRGGQAPQLGEPSPRGITGLVAAQSGTLTLPLVVAFVALVLMLPGIACLVAFDGRLRAPPGFGVALAFLAVAAVGYASFWVFFADERAGWIWSVAVTAASAVIVFSRRTRVRALLADPEFARPAILLVLVATLYLGVLYGGGVGLARDEAAITRFFYERTQDNLIPEMLADSLYAGADPRTTGLEWTTSDRPPLQGGIVLFARPLCDAAGIGGELQYQVASTLVQCMWVPVFWALSAVTGAAGRARGAALALTILSGFFLFNSLYVWPKLIASSLVVLAILLVLRREGEAEGPGPAAFALAALASSLGLLAHPGAAFTLLGAAVVLALARAVRPGRDAAGVALGVAIAIVCLAPWRAYQKLYDPPGDRLLKEHYAGVTDRADRRGAVEAIVDAWRSLPPGELAERKLRNLVVLTGIAPIMSSSLYSEDPRIAEEAARNRVVRIRTREQQHVVPCLGIANAGWVVLVLLLWRRDPRAKRLALLALAGGSGLCFGAVLLHHGGRAVTTLLSYGDILLLQASLTLALCTLSRRAVVGIVSLQAAWFAWLWIATTPPVASFALRRAPDPVAWAIAALAAVAIARQLGMIAREQVSRP